MTMLTTTDHALDEQDSPPRARVPNVLQGLENLHVAMDSLPDVPDEIFESICQARDHLRDVLTKTPATTIGEACAKVIFVARMQARGAAGEDYDMILDAAARDLAGLSAGDALSRQCEIDVMAAAPFAGVPSSSSPIAQRWKERQMLAAEYARSADLAATPNGAAEADQNRALALHAELWAHDDATMALSAVALGDLVVKTHIAHARSMAAPYAPYVNNLMADILRLLAPIS
jgi:hypothetical protein